MWSQTGWRQWNVSALYHPHIEERIVPKLFASIGSPRPPNLIAPPRHTTLLVALFLVIALLGAIFQQKPQSVPAAARHGADVIALYLALTAMEWGLLLYVKRGLRQTGTTVRALIGGNSSNARSLLIDCFLAAAVWTIYWVFDTLWNRWIGAGHPSSIRSAFPVGIVQIVLWIPVSVSASICEEITFRGYFQRQFAALTHNRAVALLLQAMLFGIGHGYQGLEQALKITCFGLLFGLLALWRQSLRPGILAHASMDIFNGIFGI
jgi:membrane protease YdiL (CAAX protease family)